MSLALSPALAPFPYAALALALAAGRQVDWVQEAKVRPMTLRLESMPMRAAGEHDYARERTSCASRDWTSSDGATAYRMPARLRIVCQSRLLIVC